MLLPNCQNKVSQLCQRISKLERDVRLQSGVTKKPLVATPTDSKYIITINILCARVSRLENRLNITKPLPCYGCNNNSLANPSAKVNRICGRVARLEKAVYG